MGGQLSSTVGVVALAAAGLAVVSLCVNAVLYRHLRRMRADQQIVLGEERADLVAHAAALDASFRTLHDYVTDVAERLDARMGVAEERLDGAIAH